MQYTHVNTVRWAELETIRDTFLEAVICSISLESNICDVCDIHEIKTIMAARAESQVRVPRLGHAWIPEPLC